MSSKWKWKRAYNGVLLTLVDRPPVKNKFNGIIQGNVLPLIVFASEFVQLAAFFMPTPSPIAFLGMFRDIITIRLDQLLGLSFSIEIEQGLFFGSAAFCIFGAFLLIIALLIFVSGRPALNPSVSLLLRAVGILMSSILYMILLMVIINGLFCFHCHLSLTNYILHVTFGPIAIVSLLLISALVVSNSFQADPRAEYVNKRPHARFDMLALVLRTIVPINNSMILPFSRTTTVIINFVVALLFVSIFLAMQPYYLRKTNALRAILYFVVLCLSLLSVVGLFVQLSWLMFAISIPISSLIALLFVLFLGPNEAFNSFVERLFLPITVGYDASHVRDLTLVASLNSPVRLGHFASYISAAWGDHDEAERLWKMALHAGGGQHEVDYALWCRRAKREFDEAGWAMDVQHYLECENRKHIVVVSRDDDAMWAALGWRRRLRRSCVWLMWCDLDDSKKPYFAIQRLIWSILGQSVDRLGLNYNDTWHQFRHIPHIQSLAPLLVGEIAVIASEIHTAFYSLVTHLSREGVVIMITGIQHMDVESWECIDKVLPLSKNVTFVLVGDRSSEWTLHTKEHECVLIDHGFCAACGSDKHDTSADCMNEIWSNLVRDKDVMKLLQMAAVLGNSAPISVLEYMWTPDDTPRLIRSFTKSKVLAKVTPTTNFEHVFMSHQNFSVDGIWYHFTRRIVRDTVLQHVSSEDQINLHQSAVTAYQSHTLPFYVDTMLLKHQTGLSLAMTQASIAKLEADSGLASAAVADSMSALQILEEEQDPVHIPACVHLLITLAESATFSDRPAAWQAIMRAKDRLAGIDETKMIDARVRLGAAQAGLHIAESSYTEAETVAREALKLQMNRFALFNLARALRFQDTRTMDALVEYRRVVRAARHANDLRMQAMSTAGLATLERSAGMYNESEGHFRLASFLFRVLGNELMALDTAEGQAMNQLMWGHLDKGAAGIHDAAIGMARLGVHRALLHTGVHMMDAAVMMCDEGLLDSAVLLMTPFLHRSPVHSLQITVHRAMLMLVQQLSVDLSRPPIPSLPASVSKLLQDVPDVSFVTDSQKIFAQATRSTHGSTRRRIFTAMIAAWIVLGGDDMTHVRSLTVCLWLLDDLGVVHRRRRGVSCPPSGHRQYSSVTGNLSDVFARREVDMWIENNVGDVEMSLVSVEKLMSDGLVVDVGDGMLAVDLEQIFV